MIEILVGLFVLVAFGLIKKSSTSQNSQEDYIPVSEDFEDTSEIYSEVLNSSNDSNDSNNEDLFMVSQSSPAREKEQKMSKIIPRKIYVFSKDQGKSEIRQNQISIPKNILFFTHETNTYLPIWKTKPQINFIDGLGEGSYLELYSEEFFFNVLILGVNFDYFIFEPKIDKDNNLLNIKERISSKKPHLFQKIIDIGLDKILKAQKTEIMSELEKRDGRTFAEINEEFTNHLFFSTLKDKITNLIQDTEKEEEINKFLELADEMETFADLVEKKLNKNNIIDTNNQFQRGYKKNQSKIVSTLVHKGRELFKKPQEGLVDFVRSPNFSNRKEADKLLNDLKKYPHAFIIGCIANKQVDADIAWLTPYNIYSQVENFEISELAKISPIQFMEIMENAKPKHRFYKMLSEEILYGINHIIETYNGDASKIWKDRPSCALVAKRFLKFKGIGPKISSMATNILARDFKIPFTGYSCIDISADVHVQRVFVRLGLCDQGSSLDEIIRIARKLNPDFPGLMDLPIWELGRDLCHVTAPKCDKCYLQKFCIYANQ